MVLRIQFQGFTGFADSHLCITVPHIEKCEIGFIAGAEGIAFFGFGL